MAAKRKQQSPKAQKQQKLYPMVFTKREIESLVWLFENLESGVPDKDRSLYEKLKAASEKEVRDAKLMRDFADLLARGDEEFNDQFEDVLSEKGPLEAAAFLRARADVEGAC